MFSRGGRNSGRHARADRSKRNPDRSLADELGLSQEDLDGDAAAAAADQEASDEATAGVQDEPAGPYDITEAPGDHRGLDLGSLKIPSVSGVEVRVQANQEGVVQQVYLVHGDSVLQLGAFAAPRSEPLWDEVREEIRKSLFDDGVAAEEITGPYGTELRARVRTQNGLKDLRFVGIDGPRWMVRAVYQGKAAVDAAKAGPLAECIRGLVVDRGNEARPVKEPLPLRLSQEMAAQVANAQATAAQPGAASAAGMPTGVPGSQAKPGGAAGPAVLGPATGQPAAAGGGRGSGAGSGTARRKPSPRPRRQQPR